jgi:hypothetical protein
MTKPNDPSLHALLRKASNQTKTGVEDTDPLFDFDDDNNATSESKYGEEEEDETQLTVAEKQILRQAAIGNNPTPPLEDEAPTSPSASLFGQVGSYRGNRININPMNNSALYDEISNMKDIHTFIGSIDGRTGLDSADAGSYRAAITRTLGSTPRSFTERLALEEAMERREADKES